MQLEFDVSFNLKPKTFESASDAHFSVISVQLMLFLFVCIRTVFIEHNTFLMISWWLIYSRKHSLFKGSLIRNYTIFFQLERVHIDYRTSIQFSEHSISEGNFFSVTEKTIKFEHGMTVLAFRWCLESSFPIIPMSIALSWYTHNDSLWVLLFIKFISHFIGFIGFHT